MTAFCCLRKHRPQFSGTPATLQEIERRLRNNFKSLPYDEPRNVVATVLDKGLHEMIEKTTREFLEEMDKAATRAIEQGFREPVVIKKAVDENVRMMLLARLTTYSQYFIIKQECLLGRCTTLVDVKFHAKRIENEYCAKCIRKIPIRKIKLIL